ncbi:MAG TPA: hypothetical protein VHB51_02040 [Candidatus Saccharimonadales bacterium]|nr:hypothetical protein [Candidatus Saccharimonadales bacterium]
MSAAAEQGTGLKSVYVARTVETSQKKFNTFVRLFGKHLGGLAAIKSTASMHLTFLESRGVKDKFHAYGYTPREVQAFKTGLERHLTKGGHAREALKVQTDSDAPLLWVGFSRIGKLAVNIQPSEQLIDARGRTEAFLINQLGVLPDLTPFTPHITIGKINRVLLTREIKNDPSLLLPEDLAVPASVTLNGLEVFLGRIHSGQYEPRVPPVSAEVAQQLADAMAS